LDGIRPVKECRAAKEFFDELAAQAEPDKIKHVNHSYLFEIEAKGRGGWTCVTER